MGFRETWHKYGEPITGITIIFFVIFAVFMIIQDRDLKKEINENCGWGEESYQCFCEKGDAMIIKNKIENKINLNFTLDNVTLVP